MEKGTTLDKYELIDKIPKDWNNIYHYVNTLSQQCYFEHYFEKDKEFLIIDEVELEGKQFLIELDIENKTITFTDDLVSYSYYNRILNVDESHWNETYERMLKSIEDKEYKLIPRDDGNYDYVWCELKVGVENFKKDDLIEVVKLWERFNEEMRDLYLRR